ncbi:MAG: hypothetical protein V4671_33105 [Armatimonadota bacterium]
MPESRKRPAPLEEDFSKAFGSAKTSASPAADSPAREVKMGPLCPYCKAGVGAPYALSSKTNRTEAAEVVLIYCTRCGYTLGVLPAPIEY